MRGDTASSTDFAAQNQQLQIQLQSCCSSSSAGTYSPHPRKCPVNPPDKFEGSSEEFSAFLAQGLLYIQLQAGDFPDDKTLDVFHNKPLKREGCQMALELSIVAHELSIASNFPGFVAQTKSPFLDLLKSEKATQHIWLLCWGGGGDTRRLTTPQNSSSSLE